MRMNSGLQRSGASDRQYNLDAMVNHFRLDFEIHKFYTKFSRWYLGTKHKILGSQNLLPYLMHYLFRILEHVQVAPSMPKLTNS